LSNKRNLSRKKKLDIAREVAQYMSPAEAVRYVKETYNIDTTPQYINEIFLKKGTRWNVIVTDMRAQYLATTMEEAIAQKRVRLRRYDELYQKAIAQNKISAAKACLDSVREEVEGGKSTAIGNVVFAQINNMSDDQLEQEKQNLLNKLDKLGVKPRAEVIDTTGE